MRRLAFLGHLLAFLLITCVPALLAGEQETNKAAHSAGNTVPLDESWNFPDFSAIQLLPVGPKPLPMKVYRYGTSVRVDTSPALADLYVPSSDKVYRLTVYPDKTRQCIVMRSEQAKMLPSPLELLNGTKVKRTPMGTEPVDGHTCKVENVVVTRADGKPIESKVWEAEDLKGVPVKIESHIEGGTLTAIYRDIVLGTPDKALFAPPEKCIPYEKMYQVAEDKAAK